MEPNDWIQLTLTIVAMLLGGVVFYFKNLEVLRKEITGSEGRLRTELGTRIDAVVGEVHKLDVSVARLDERMPARRSGPTAEVPAE
ncbi:MAG TPA: hypothetical protein VJN18_25155 [Polyangiaceae bacterium]|nr:hypothetical protein [Polyangiaceae bacterium]